MARLKSTQPDKAPVPAEREVLKATLAVLKAHGVLAWRTNVGAVAVAASGGAKRRFVRFGMAGQSDILGVLPSGPGDSDQGGGRLLACEVKRQGAFPTVRQLDFLRAVNAAGAVGLWVDDAATLDRLLPRILAGARVEIDEAGFPWIVDKED